MFEKLRVVFCILSVLCVAACVPIGIFFEWFCLIPIGGAVLFGFLMLAAKNGFRRPKPEPKTDFMNTEEENEKIRQNAQPKE